MSNAQAINRLHYEVVEAYDEHKMTFAQHIVELTQHCAAAQNAATVINCENCAICGVTCVSVTDSVM